MPTVAAVAVFLLLLVFGVQVALDLYATSAATSVAHDAARAVAGADAADRDAATAAAEAHARQVLGRYASRVTFEWAFDDEVVRLRVQAQNPSLLPPAFKQPLGVDTVDRTVRVRAERVR